MEILGHTDTGRQVSCSICFDAPANYLVMHYALPLLVQKYSLTGTKVPILTPEQVVPCGHECGCEECLSAVQRMSGRCPICRGAIDSLQRVFRCGGLGDSACYSAYLLY